MERLIVHLHSPDDVPKAFSASFSTILDHFLLDFADSLSLK